MKKKTFLLGLMIVVTLIFLISGGGLLAETIYKDDLPEARTIRLYAVFGSVEGDIPYVIDNATSEPVVVDFVYPSCSIRNANTSGSVRGRIITGQTRYWDVYAYQDYIIPAFHEESEEYSTFDLTWLSQPPNSFAEMDIYIDLFDE